MIDQQFWRGRRVLLTGHTGFKGAWASLLLSSLGAEVTGLALPPDNADALFTRCGIEQEMHHRIVDIRDCSAVSAAVRDRQPEIVIHMAAQALVRPSYSEPVDTFATNIMGTVHLLEAVRHVRSVQAVVVVTSDKCYENVGWVWPYRETDRLGGHDPYSNSKGCAELVTSSYRRSFFNGPGAARVATVRAGNVIGGGDWAQDRLVPDAMRAFIGQVPLGIRNPQAVRPWQHVLDPVVGYLLLAERLCAGGDEFADAWNFGPSASSEVPVAKVADHLVALWGGDARWEQIGGPQPHEAAYLKLDSAKAHARLGWWPRLDLPQALDLTVGWYRAFAKGADLRALSLAQIDRVLNG